MTGSGAPWDCATIETVICRRLAARLESSLKKKIAARNAGKPLAAEAPKARRKRQGGVRSRLVEMLAAGPLPAQQLLEQGGFSPASLYLNLKALKADGLIDTAREGRSVCYALIGKAAADPARRGRKPGVRTAAPAADDLRHALGVLMARLAPIEAADEKLMVLGQLAESLPGPVSKVLLAVIDDLSRLSGKR